MSVKSDKFNLTRNQARALRALFEHRRIEDAAQATGVSVRTLYRWLQDPCFRFALTHAEANTIDDAVRRLIADLKDNHETMRQIRDNENASTSIRLRAAQILDNSLLRWRELRDLELRLVALESEIYGNQDK